MVSQFMFKKDLSLENSAGSYLCFRLAFLHSVSYFFFLYRSPSLFLCMVFDSISSNINPFANMFVFGDFSIHHKNWLTYSCGNDRSDGLCYNISQVTLHRWLTFLLVSLSVILTVLPFWIYLFLLMLVFVLQWLSLHWEILIMLLPQFPLTFHNIYNRMPRFIPLLMTILMLIGTFI